MELLELTNSLKELFVVDGPDKLGQALLECALNANVEQYDAYCALVENDLNTDYLQAVYQYYCADRKGKKQDYTPACIADLVSAMTCDSETIVDMCAGSGALTIQRWKNKPDAKFFLYELDENVIPFMLFNLAVRNIDASVFVGDVLCDETELRYKVYQGEKYGRVVTVESAV